jgi:hypothetical protein
MGHYADYLRWLYRSGRPNRFAKLQNRATAAVYAAGIWPRRVAASDVRGRKSGRLISFPVVIANCDGERYLVSMLGQDVTTRSLPSCGVTWTWLREHVRTCPSTAALRSGRSSRSHPGSRSSASWRVHSSASHRKSGRAKRAGLGLPCAALALPMAPA